MTTGTWSSPPEFRVEDASGDGDAEPVVNEDEDEILTNIARGGP